MLAALFLTLAAYVAASFALMGGMRLWAVLFTPEIDGR